MMVAVRLGDRLLRLDRRLFPKFRQQGETAEAYLRRVASWSKFGLGGTIAPDLKQALREYFAEQDRRP